MQLSHDTRNILRKYKALVSQKRRETGLSPVTTAKVMEENCESAARQRAVYLCWHFILQGGQGDGKLIIRAVHKRRLYARENPVTPAG